MEVKEIEPRKLVIKREKYGHSVHVDGHEIEGVRAVSIRMVADEVPTVTLVLNSPIIDCEYDHEAYKR